MQYFTNELWSRINSESPIEREQADHEWEQNVEAYRKVFEISKQKLSKKFLKMYFDAKGFHDHDFVSFEIIQPKRWASDPIKVTIVVSDGESKWTLTYKKVKKLTMNYDSTIEEHMSKWGIYTWGYDEFLPVDEDYLTHEVLFASGASILIHFKNKNLYIVKEPIGKIR